MHNENRLRRRIDKSENKYWKNSYTECIIHRNCAVRRPVDCGRNSAVECQLPKLDVEGSNPFARFIPTDYRSMARRYVTKIALVYTDGLPKREKMRLPNPGHRHSFVFDIEPFGAGQCCLCIAAELCTEAGRNPLQNRIRNLP